jgi:hypothetical protein
MTLCGPRHPSAGDTSVAVWRPRFTSAVTDGLSDLVDYLALENGDPRCGDMKHAFLPERWPTADAADAAYAADAADAARRIRRQRCTRVDDALQSDWLVPNSLQRNLPGPEWKSVMPASGWDNAVDRMATKYAGNIKATRGVPTARPLVFAAGSAGFAATGKGELPAPTAKMTRALERGG